MKGVSLVVAYANENSEGVSFDLALVIMKRRLWHVQRAKEWYDTYSAFLQYEY